MDFRNILHLAGPPRNVPLLVRFRVLFGGALHQFGWALFGFAMIFIWSFTLNADMTSWFRFLGRADTTEGKVFDIEETAFSEGGSEDDDGTPVYAFHYSFTGPGGSEYQGVSFHVGRRFNTGQKVTIQYLRAKPKISRIKGTRRGSVGLFGGLVPLFFLSGGLFLLVRGMKKGIKANRLLTLGEQTTGRLKSKEKTDESFNDKSVYKLTFEFNTPEGKTYQAVARTHEIAKLQDEAEEPLLYDPRRPSYAVMLDDLPGGPRIQENGQIRPGPAIKTIKVLIIPLATIIGNATYLYFKCIR